MHQIGLADFKAMFSLQKEKYIEALNRVGASGWLVLGHEVSAFEEDLARYASVQHAVGLANGLDGLEIALRCEGVRPGDRVITTPLSAFATTLAIARTGAVPVFVDVDASGLLDLSAAEEAMKLTPSPRFIMPVHLFGHVLSLTALKDFATRHGVVVIEDSAQAIGAFSQGLPVGSASRISATSFYPTKNLGALGDAGAVLTNDVGARDLARSLRDYGQSSKYVHDLVGLNSRLDELQAAFLRTAQLPILKEQTEHRKTIAARYLQELQNEHFRFPDVPAGSDSVWHLFPILSSERDRFRAHLAALGISTGLHYPIIIPVQKAMATVEHLTLGNLAHARMFADQEISLPLHPFMSHDDVSRVIAAANSFRV
jgi:dTDP-4-amino-4,6-dideoxygalactose transaminase